MFKFFLSFLFFSMCSSMAFSIDDIEVINQYCVEIDNDSELLTGINVTGSDGENVDAYFKEGHIVRISVDFISHPRSKRVLRDYYIKAGVLLKVTEMVRISEDGNYTELFYRDGTLFHVIQNDESIELDDFEIQSLSEDAITKLDEYLLLTQ